MLITKEQQGALIDKYIREKHSQDECIGFIDGLNAMLGLVVRLSKKETRKETKKGKTVTFDDAWHYIGIDDVEYKLLHDSEYNEAVKIILTTYQLEEHNSCDTSREFNVSDARIAKFLDFYNGKDNIWRKK